jgi:hypothetical protein
MLTDLLDTAGDPFCLALRFKVRVTGSAAGHLLCPAAAHLKLVAELVHQSHHYLRAGRQTFADIPESIPFPRERTSLTNGR